MENLDSREKPTLPSYFTRGASGRMVPHGLLPGGGLSTTVCGSTIAAWRAGSSAGVSAALSSGLVNVTSTADLPPQRCRDGRMPGVAVPRLGEATTARLFPCRM